MKIQYQSNLEDWVSAYFAAERRNRIRLADRLTLYFLYGHFLATVTYLGLMVVGTPAIARAVLSISAGILFMCYHIVNHRSYIRKQYEEHCTEQRGTAGPIDVTVEIEETRMTAQFRGVTVHYEWPVIRLIEDRPGYITIIGSHDAGVSIPDRAFADAAERRAFLDLARKYRAAAPGEWKSRDHQLCRGCGYDLFGTEGEQCPECGVVTGLPAVQTNK